MMSMVRCTYTRSCKQAKIFLLYLSKPKLPLSVCVLSLARLSNVLHKKVMNNERTSNTSFYNTITSICTYLIAQTKITGSISLLKLHLVIIGKHRVNIKIPNYVLQLLKWKHLKEYTHITSSVTFSPLCTGGALDTHTQIYEGKNLLTFTSV